MDFLIAESRLEKRLKNKVFKFCWICGDEASSKHFSALSCDACAAFFRRSVSGKKVYQCLYKQNCAIYNITPRRMCKFCRYQKCRKSGMNPEEVRSGTNSPTNSPPPKEFSTPNSLPPIISSHQQQPQYPQYSSTSMSSIQISIPTSSIIPSSLLPSTATTTTPSPTPIMKAFHRAIILENSLFVAVKNPVLLSAYLQPPHDSKILEIALKNFQKISDKFSTFNNFFMFQYIESAGIILDPKMVEKFPAINHLIHQSLQQYAEIMQIRMRNEFEFAALCQLSLLKITSEEFPQFQKILKQNFEIVTQNFREYYANEPGENPSISLSNVLDLANTIHLIRKTYRNQICGML